MARSALSSRSVAGVLAVPLAVLLVGCGSSREGGVRPLPEQETDYDRIRQAAYEVDCGGCRVTWFSGGDYQSASVDGRWRRQLQVEPGDRLELSVRRERDPRARIVARIVVRGRAEDRGRLESSRPGTRLVLTHRVR